MRILLSNDDGIYSEGIQALKEHLNSIAEVIVIAPDRERSTISHAMTLRKPLKVKEVKSKGKLWGFSINGTPADCIIVGLLEIMKDEKPDLIVSGINHGPNLGNDIIYSGTVGAAMEGAMRNIPSLAVSIDDYKQFKFNSAARFTKEIISNLIKHNLPKNLLLNINFPNIEYEELEGIKITRHGRRAYQDELNKINDPCGRVHYWLGGELKKGEVEQDTDFGAVYNRKVSITPISLDLSDYSIMPEMKKWVKKWNSNCNNLI